MNRYERIAKEVVRGERDLSSAFPVLFVMALVVWATAIAIWGYNRYVEEMFWMDCLQNQYWEGEQTSVAKCKE